MNQIVEVGEKAAARAHRRRRDGVEYRLRVIPGSDGLLELVEQPPQPSRFAEWARAMQFTGWGFWVKRAQLGSRHLLDPLPGVSLSTPGFFARVMTP